MGPLSKIQKAECVPEFRPRAVQFLITALNTVTPLWPPMQAEGRAPSQAAFLWSQWWASSFLPQRLGHGLGQSFRVPLLRVQTKGASLLASQAPPIWPRGITRGPDSSIVG